MKPITDKRFVRGLAVLAALCMILIASCGSSGGQPEKDYESEIDPRWYTLRPTPVPIPENSGGEARLTRNFYFIFDGSGSMSQGVSQNCGGDQKFGAKIEGARWAIRQFMQKVPKDVNIGLYVFDNTGEREVTPLGVGNRDTFMAAIAAVDAGGGTPLAKAITFGADRLAEQYKKQLGYGEFRLVVITDGIAQDIPKAAIYAASYGFPIYAIGLCVPADHPLRHYSVSYRAADNFSDLAKGLEDTLGELPNFDATRFDSQ